MLSETDIICLSAHSLRQPAPLPQSTVFEEAWVVIIEFCEFCGKIYFLVSIRPASLVDKKDGAQRHNNFRHFRAF
jgi:hypothetical protein